MSTSWLQKQRKAVLLELSFDAGLPQEQDLRKDEILEALDEHLRANATRLSNNATFYGYYGARTKTPVTKRHLLSDPAGPGSWSDVRSDVREWGKRPAKVKADMVDDDDYSAPASTSRALTATTSANVKRAPGRPRRSERIPTDNIPPSPAVVTDAIVHETTRIYAGFNDLLSVSGLPETVAYIRELCSSVVGVESACLVLEAYGLQSEILPWRYAGIDLPASRILGLPEIPVKFPDLFIFLTGFFWGTTMLWAATSLLIPLLFAYFFNLSAHPTTHHGVTAIAFKYDFDPLAFNVSKALFTWLVYSQRASFGVVSEIVAERVNHAMYGGYNGVMVGSFIGVIASLYDAAQRK